jgi:hypothetical protein
MGIYTEEPLDEIEAYLAAAGFGEWPSPRKTSSSATIYFTTTRAR